MFFLHGGEGASVSVSSFDATDGQPWWSPAPATNNNTLNKRHTSLLNRTPFSINSNNNSNYNNNISGTPHTPEHLVNNNTLRPATHATFLNPNLSNDVWWCLIPIVWLEADWSVASATTAGLSTVCYTPKLQHNVEGAVIYSCQYAEGGVTFQAGLHVSHSFYFSHFGFRWFRWCYTMVCYGMVSDWYLTILHRFIYYISYIIV